MVRRTWTAALLAALMLMAALPAVAADSSTDSEAEPSFELTQFTDTVGTTFEAAIDWLVDQGITVGCNPPSFTMFCPNDPVTRGQMAVFLSRALSLPAPSADHFTDDSGAFYESAANRMFEAGITVGCNPPSNTQFCGEDEVTRAQMATFLTRGFGFPDTGTDYFIDDNTSVHQGSINRIREANVTVGCNPPTGNRFCPSDTVTRGQMAAFIKRAVEFEPPCSPPQGATESECQALIDFYNGTNGDSWTNNTNWLSGDACTWFGVTCNGGHVTMVILQTNNLTGMLPSAVSNLTGLLTLDLSDNTMGGSIPAALGSMTTLTTLDLSDNELTGSIPSQLGNLSALTSFDLSANVLSGSIPSSLGNLSNVMLFDLNKNGLSGQLPDSFDGLTALTTLSLSENSLDGAVKAELGTLPSLAEVDLELNGFDSIEADFWDSTSYQDVDISDNTIAGSLPETFPSTLTDLDLSSNQLTGIVPDALATIASLTSLTLANNQLDDNDVPDFDVQATLTELTLNTNVCMDTNPHDAALEMFIAALDPLWSTSSTGACP